MDTSVYFISFVSRFMTKGRLVDAGDYTRTMSLLGESLSLWFQLVDIYAFYVNCVFKFTLYFRQYIDRPMWRQRVGAYERSTEIIINQCIKDDRVSFYWPHFYSCKFLATLLFCALFFWHNNPNCWYYYLWVRESRLVTRDSLYCALDLTKKNKIYIIRKIYRETNDSSLRRRWSWERK